GTGGYHPLHWLEHAYLQLGRDEDAAKLVAIIEDDAKRTPSPYSKTHLAMCRATFLVESRGTRPASMMEPVDPSSVVSQGVFAGHDMAIGLEQIRRKDQNAARRSLDSVRSRNTAMKSAKTKGGGASRYSTVSQSDIDTVSVMEMVLVAAIEFASGDRESAIRKASAAGEAEDKLVFEYGPPAIVKPAWESAGEMLLASGKKKEAAEAFRKVLKRYPNRRLSIEGLTKATN
ncbi:MAG: tetratricopeptide repeat protein, partial [Pyrinomonadaceae bacterium]